MGIITRQTIKGSLWSYLGVMLGFVTTSYLYPTFLTTELIGLFSLLLAYSKISGRLALLGLNGAMIRMFPYFRNKENGHNGFLGFAFLINLIGISLFIVAFLIFKNRIIENNLEKSALFSEYVYLLLPIAISISVFLFLDSFNKVLYNAVLGVFLQEFLQRFFIFLITLLYAFKFVDVSTFILAFALVISLKTFILFFYLFSKGEIRIKRSNAQVEKKIKKEFVTVSIYSILGGLGSIVIYNLDKIIVNQITDLSSTGVYTIAFFFGSLVILPSRPLLNISSALISDAWKNNKTELIKTIYHKSCLNQFIIGGFLFLLLWANVDNIIEILGEEYRQSKWVIFFVGIGYLIDMLTGANSRIITLSKRYKTMTIFVVLLMLMETVLLYLFVPIWGITGAAIAIALSLFLFNLVRFLFLLVVFKMQPFNWKFLAILAILLVVFGTVSLVPYLGNLYLDTLVRSFLIAAETLLIFWLLPLSDEIRQLKNAAKAKVSSFFKR